MTTEAIKDDLDSAPSKQHQNAILKSAYAAGWTLQELGDLMGFTREGIRQRVSKPVPLSMMREYEPHERVKVKTSERVTKQRKTQRILGLRLSSPALQVPVSTLDRLAELHELATTVRGFTPLDSPARQAIKPFGDLLFNTINYYQIPQKHLERALGLKGNSLTAWLRGHGYMSICPSQKPYRGLLLDNKENGRKRKGRTKLVPGATCFHGHALTEDLIGIVRATQARYCRQCSRDQSKVRYAEKKKVRP